MRHSDDRGAVLARAARGDRRALPALVEAFGPALLAMAQAAGAADPQAATVAALVRVWDESPLLAQEGVAPATFAQLRLRAILREGRPRGAAPDLREELADTGPLPGADIPLLRGIDPDRAEAITRAWTRAEGADALSARFGMPPGALRDWLAPAWPRIATEALAGLAPDDLRLSAEIAADLVAPAAVRGRLGADAVLRAAVALWRDRLAALAPMPAPPLPHDILPRVATALFPDHRRGWLARLGVLPALAGAAAAAALYALAERMGWIAGP